MDYAYDYYDYYGYGDVAQSSATTQSTNYVQDLLQMSGIVIIGYIVVFIICLILIAVAFNKSGRMLAISLNGECGTGAVFAGIALGLAFCVVLCHNGMSFVAWILSLCFSSISKGYIKREYEADE